MMKLIEMPVINFSLCQFNFCKSLPWFTYYYLLNQREKLKILNLLFNISVPKIRAEQGNIHYIFKKTTIAMNTKSHIRIHPKTLSKWLKPTKNKV